MYANLKNQRRRFKIFNDVVYNLNIFTLVYLKYWKVFFCTCVTKLQNNINVLFNVFILLVKNCYVQTEKYFV